MEHFDSLLWLSTIEDGRVKVEKYGYLTGDFKNASSPLLAQKGYLYFVRDLKNGALAIFNQNFTEAVILIDAVPVLKITSRSPLSNSQLIYDSERLYLLYNKTLYMVKPSKGDYHFPEDFRKVASFSDNFISIGAYKGRLFLVSNNGTYLYDAKNASLSIVVSSKAQMSGFHNGEALLFANSTLYDVSDNIVRVGKINLKTFNASEFHKLFYITLDCRKEHFEEGTNVFWSSKGWLIYNGSSLYFFNGTLKKVLDNVSWIRWIGWDGKEFILAGNSTILKFDGQRIENLTPKLKEFLGTTSPPSSPTQVFNFSEGTILILIVLLFLLFLMGIYLVSRKRKW
ncbi:hypothetical protein E3E31_00495 [Thermococcus sp. M39]|uniref:hypothetical protein n=1 Tax=unclassified Thermococcus TaxID=2627626 RepID=UPI00143B754E|nr:MULTISPECIES: hypothetical protein [unclassified Thermococcus]NJE07033.1 hypothetical protein [Thermococcus sp. M39]NJE13571.1 hypothetical protein [Thermococcus sp. LS2]